MTLADVKDEQRAALTCGCGVRRLFRGANSYIRIKMLTPLCKEHEPYADVTRSEDEETEVDAFHTDLLTL